MNGVSVQTCCHKGLCHWQQGGTPDVWQLHPHRSLSLQPAVIRRRNLSGLPANAVAFAQCQQQDEQPLCYPVVSPLVPPPTYLELLCQRHQALLCLAQRCLVLCEFCLRCCNIAGAAQQQNTQP